MAVRYCLAYRAWLAGQRIDESGAVPTSTGNLCNEEERDQRCRSVREMRGGGRCRYFGCAPGFRTTGRAAESEVTETDAVFEGDVRINRVTA